MQEKDELIYSRFLKGRNENDMRLLLERHREGLFLFLLGIVLNEEDAEELMMDAFARVAAGTAHFSGRSSFKTWLFSIARNQARMFLRKKRIPSVHTDEATLSSGDAPDLALLIEEQNRQLFLALNSLPDDYRQVLYLLYFEEMSREEAALVMRKTKKQIYKLTEHGKDALRDALERMGFEYEKYR